MAERKPATARRTSPLKAVPNTPARARKAPTKKPPALSPEPPEAPVLMTVRAAAESGNDRDLLVRLRNRIATDIDNPSTPPRDLAALTRRIQEIAKDIKALDARAEGEGTKGGPVPDESFDASAI